jgi:hypothetical protein
MKPMVRRLRLLEHAYRIEEYVEREDSPVAILRARRLKRLQMEGGVIPEPTPPMQYPRGTSVAEILRGGRQRAHDRTTALALGGANAASTH